MKVEKEERQSSGEKRLKDILIHMGIFLPVQILVSIFCIEVDQFGMKNDVKNDHEVMRFDLRKIRESDIILVNLEDIRYSIGTSDEIFYGFISQKPIIGFINTDRELTRKEIMDYVHTWKFEQIDRIETGVNAQQKAMDYIMYRYGV